MWYPVGSRRQVQLISRTDSIGETYLAKIEGWSGAVVDNFYTYYQHPYMGQRKAFPFPSWPHQRDKEKALPFLYDSEDLGPLTRWSLVFPLLPTTRTHKIKEEE